MKKSINKRSHLETVCEIAIDKQLEWKEHRTKMKNIKVVYDLIDRRNKGEYDDPIKTDEYRETLVECFNCKDDVEEFIQTGDYNYVDALGEVYEEIIEKFPSERLKYLFKRFVFPSYPDGIPTAAPKYDAALDEWQQ